ncbi:MAG: hypothetical protein WCG25_02445 [bacterium]
MFDLNMFVMVVENDLDKIVLYQILSIFSKFALRVSGHHVFLEDLIINNIFNLKEYLNIFCL